MKVNFLVDFEEGYDILIPLETVTGERRILELDGWRYDEKDYCYKRPKSFLSEREIELHKKEVELNRLYIAVEFMKREIERLKVEGVKVRVSGETIVFDIRKALVDEEKCSEMQVNFIRTQFSNLDTTHILSNSDLRPLGKRAVWFVTENLKWNPKIKFELNILN